MSVVPAQRGEKLAGQATILAEIKKRQTRFLILSARSMREKLAKEY